MKVVILCGGKGTRAYPYTEHFPKPMMPISGTPVLVHLMRIYANQGIKEFILSAGHRKEMLYDYFEGRFNDWKVQIVDTGEDADTGDRIKRCEPYLDGRFFATYGDGLGNLDMKALLAAHESSGSVATLTTVPLRAQYGLVVYGEDKLVERFEEKPLIRDYWINAGFMVFELEALQDWQGNNLEKEVLPHLAKHGKLSVYEHEGFWKSMDTSKDQNDLERLQEDGPGPWVVDPE